MACFLHLLQHLHLELIQVLGLLQLGLLLLRKLQVVHLLLLLWLDLLVYLLLLALVVVVLLLLGFPLLLLVVSKLRPRSEHVEVLQQLLLLQQLCTNLWIKSLRSCLNPSLLWVALRVSLCRIVLVLLAPELSSSW